MKSSGSLLAGYFQSLRHLQTWPSEAFPRGSFDYVILPSPPPLYGGLGVSSGCVPRTHHTAVQSSHTYSRSFCCALFRALGLPW